MLWDSHLKKKQEEEKKKFDNLIAKMLVFTLFRCWSNSATSSYGVPNSCFVPDAFPFVWGGAFVHPNINIV